MAPLAERYVRIRLDTRGFPGELKQFLRGDQFAALGAAAGKEWASGFKTAVKAELASAKYKVKVEADWSGFKNPPGVPRVKAPGSSSPGPASAPVDVDPVLAAFQADVRRQVAALSRQVAVHVPVTADTEKLRTELSAELRALQDKAKVKVDAEAPDRAKFETELRAMLASAQARVAGFRPPKVPVELDALTTQFQANVRRELAGLTRLAVRIPVNPDTDGLRRDIALRIAAIERTLKIKVPVDSPDSARIRSELESSLSGLKSILGGALGVAPQALQALSGGFDAVSGSATKAAGSASQLGASLSEAAGPAGTAVTFGLIAAAITAIPAAALAATGAVYSLGGALASLPALGVGLGAILGTLGLGFSGISDHLKTLPKSAGGAAKSLSAVHSATRSLASAQQDLLKATKDLDKARADEIERIDDLGRSLRGAMLDEEDATAAVAEARKNLAEARASGDVNAIGAADRAYRRSLLTLDEARDKTGDLQQEKARADRDGVEGSDQVQAALQRQADAVDRLTAAQEALADAQKSGGGAASAALAKLQKLAPAAQQVVDKIKQLKPAFEDLRLSVQQALFQGVAGDLQRLSDAWKQPLKSTLTSYASTFNGLFKDLGATVRKPEFISNITSAAETFRQNFEKVGKAVAGPLADAFGKLAKAAKPFIDALGDKFAGLVQHFSEWIDQADKSGKLNKFFQDAAHYLKLIWDIGGNLFGVFSDFFAIFNDSKTQGGAKDFLDGFNKQLIGIREWLKDPENQKKVKEWIDDFGKFVKNVEKIAVVITTQVIPAVIQFGNWIEWLKTKYDELRKRWDIVKAALLSPLDFSGVFDGLTSAFRGALNNAIAMFNRLHLGLSFSLSPSSATITGSARKLATGGVVQPRPGGVPVTVAEAGEAEIVEPRSEMRQLLVEAVRAVMAETRGGDGDSGATIVIPVYIGTEKVDEIVVKAAERNKARVAKAVNGGNRQLGYAG